MPDSEQHYPFHQPDRDEPERRHHPFDDAQPELVGEEEAPRQRMHQRDHASTPQLPPRRFGYALMIGVVAGLLASVQSIVIAFVNSPTYQQAAAATGQNAINLAFVLLGIACLTWFIAALINVIAGFITGKVSVQRRLGFVTGFVSGVVYYIVAVFLVRYIPAYPGTLAGSGKGGLVGVSGGLLVSLIFLVVVGLIGGAFSLLGAWLATRRHPYYVGYAG
ncbi:MAG: hypothetical protein H0W02_01565 [Ktedonobacteraceae bacterium]|nr:hypothetical protein [Ktedonobacteraceae bacterium]